MYGSTMPDSGARILILEDDVFLADDMRRSLEDAGYEVLGPFDEQSSELSHAFDREPHAAILDMKLRGDGTSAIVDRLQSLDIPIIVPAGYAHAEVRSRISDLSLVEKPYSMSKIVAAVRSVLRRRPGKAV
ncbi:response regulator [Sphingobium sp. SCG-1]|uniref:response regulator transcription factor n=1 Tax=Sphingobium sp. SCG-1 TaxID=2072936 RepID=UPI000CD6BB0F|nr:response regulator transcription factor [Sphingobium sp. SCG-1]AUW57343.1 response regulator [Sphingobium sp. SCG-1]